MMNLPAVLKYEEGRPGVVHLVLNRPEKRNALSIELMTAIARACHELAVNHQVRAVIFRGEGSVFCAGLDLTEAHDAAKSEACARAVVQMLQSIYHLPQVTLAVVQGAAVAGGAGLMSACDLVLAAEDAKIGYPEVKRGLVAASVMALLRRQIGERDARELLILGELISASRAYEIGLINRVVPVAAMDQEVQRTVDQILQAAPGAVAQTKRLLEQLWPCHLEKDFDHTLHSYLSARGCDEAQEGIRAFLEKRKPRWQES